MKNIFLFLMSLYILIISTIFHFSTELGFEFFGLIKPITAIQYFGFITFALILNICKPLFLKANKELLMVFLFMVMMASLFEMLWSFGYWFSTYELKVKEGLPDDSNTLDTLNYNPAREYIFYKNTSLNSSAKFNTMVFVMSVYFIWFINIIWKQHI